MPDVECLVRQVGEQFGLDVGPCSESDASEIEQLKLDEMLTKLFTCCWPLTVDGMFGPYRIRSAGQILNYDQLEVFLPQRRIPIGDAICGDLLLLSTDPPNVVALFDHERLWCADDACGETTAVIADSITGFMEAVLRGSNLPIDHYAARVSHKS